MEAILSGFVTDVSARLAAALANKVFMWHSVEDNLKDLHQNFQIIQGVLHTAQAPTSETIAVTQWLAQLEEISNHIEDLLDESVARLSQAKKASYVSSVLIPFYRFELAGKIKAASGNLKSIVDRRKIFMGHHAISFVKPLHPKTESHSSVPQLVVGLEKSMTEMVGNLILKEYADDIVAIPIVGMGGLGKTTLAQSLFNCKEITDHFELMIWVDGSREDDVKSIIKKIVISQRSGMCDHLEMESLRKQLCEIIDGKKYLIVMDDIWNDNLRAWNELKDLLIPGAKGSRLVVTTRKLSVAEATRPGCTFKLNELSEDDSLELFKIFASSDGDEWTQDHHSIGQQIVAKCFGVPLAIKSLGLLLHSKTLNEWRRIKDKELKNIDQSEGNIMSILQLSYNNLPSHLKACFVFCGVFPPGKTIDVVELVDLWQVSGLIQKSDDEDSYEEIGKGYVWDLIRSSLLDHVRDDERDRIKFAKMHDLIFDLCNGLSKGHILVDKEGEKLTNNIRHLRLLRCNVDWKVLLAMLRAKRNLKTLILEKELDQKQCELIVKSFQKLRTLGMRNYGGSIPSSIGRLVHLRYLDLSRSKCERVPESITDLWHLQVLKLDFCTNLQTLPKGMKKMINLMKLRFEGAYDITMPKGIGQLTSLCQLSRFKITEEETGASLEELRTLRNLVGTLSITSLEHAGKCEESILEKTIGLENLNNECSKAAPQFKCIFRVGIWKL